MRHSGDLQRIADVIGIEAASRLAEVFRGQRLYIRKSEGLSVRAYILAHPEASATEVMEACGCSRPTYYRVKGQVQRGD